MSLLDDGGATAVIEHDGLGEVSAEFFYLEKSLAAKVGVDSGWYFADDSDFEYSQNGRVIPMGSGYMIDNGDGEVYLTFSGEVVAEPIKISLGDNFNFTGNASPVNINLGDVIPEGNTFDGTVLSLLDDGGATVVIDHEELGEVSAEFFYLDATLASKVGVDAGWYFADDSDFEYCQNGMIVTPGSGFMLDNGDGEVTITIPSAL